MRVIYFLALTFALVFTSSCGSEQQTTDGGSTDTAAVEDSICETTYQEFVAKYPVNFSECLPNVEGSPCQKPSSDYVDSFKEYLNVLVLLDSSGSMAQEVAGGKKMDIAKNVISDFVQTLPERTKIGLVVYGHKGTNEPAGKNESCSTIETVYDLSSLDKGKFTSAVKSFDPVGYTPIDKALQTAKGNLSNFGGETNSNIIYLVSDGKETCGGNPVEVAKNLHESDIQAVVNIIGFDVDNEGQQQLKQAAEAGGGKYFDVRSADEMKKVFNDYKKQLAEMTDYRDCLNSKQSKDWFAKHAASFDYFNCMRKKRNVVWEGVRKEKMDLLKDDSKKQCIGYIDKRNDAWKDAIDKKIDEVTNRLDNEKDASAEQIEKEIQAVEKERERLMKKSQ